jgi:hypothetical protein
MERVIVEERHKTIRTVAGIVAGLIVVLSLITSITYYNVEALKVPVKYEHSNSTQYERGNSNGNN